LHGSTGTAVKAMIPPHPIWVILMALVAVSAETRTGEAINLGPGGSPEGLFPDGEQEVSAASLAHALTGAGMVNVRPAFPAIVTAAPAPPVAQPALSKKVKRLHEQWKHMSWRRRRTSSDHPRHHQRRRRHRRRRRRQHRHHHDDVNEDARQKIKHHQHELSEQRHQAAQVRRRRSTWQTNVWAHLKKSDRRRHPMVQHHVTAERRRRSLPQCQHCGSATPLMKELAFLRHRCNLNETQPNKHPVDDRVSDASSREDINQLREENERLQARFLELLLET